MAKQFASAEAFKQSLEANLRKFAVDHDTPYQTLRTKFAIERLLARLFRAETAPWLLKGGFAMDLRFRPKARTTKDVDLSVTPAPQADLAAVELREQMQDALDADLGDYLQFRIGKPTHELTNAPGGGFRFPCEVRLAGKVFAKLGIDIGCGDALVGTPDVLTGYDCLAFTGIAPATVRAIPIAQQFAEKIHAFTFPWTDRPNTRTRDIVDLLLLVERQPPSVVDLKMAIHATFTTRGTHPIPEQLSRPPAEWQTVFAEMAEEAALSTTDCETGFEILAAFWNTHRFGAGN